MDGKRTGMRDLTPDEQAACETVIRLLDEGAIGRAAVRSTEEANYKAMWEEAISEAREVGWINYRSMQSIVKRQPAPGPILAVNTTNPNQLQGL